MNDECANQMADSPRFGPDGMPPGFEALKQPVTKVPKYLHYEGLDSSEYQMVRWGPIPQIRQDVAEQSRKKTIENDVWLTAHGSYFINLTATKEEVLDACAKAQKQ